MEPKKRIKLEISTKTMTHSSLHDILRGTNSKIEDIQAFLDRDKSSINEVDQCGETPLLLVLSKDNYSIDIVQLLLKYGANVNIQDRNGQFPLFYALRYSDEALVRTLIGGFSSVNEVDLSNNTPLILAITNNCSYNIVKILLEYGANVNHKGGCGRSPLHYALEWNNDEAIIEALIKAPDLSCINELDQFNRTPLLCAIQFKCSAYIVKLLLKFGANVNHKDKCGRSLLYFALEWKSDEAIIRALLQAPHFDINEVNEKETPKTTLLLFAIHSNCPSNIVKALVQYGARVSFKDFHNALQKKRDEAIIRILLEAPDFDINEINLKNSIEPTHLFSAIFCRCSSNIIKVLLQYGANIDSRNRYGFPPLKYALDRVCRFNMPSDKVLVRDEVIAKSLIKYSYLKIKNFRIEPLPQDNVNYEKYNSFAAKCALEVQEMLTVEVSHGRTLHDVVSEDSSPQSSVADNNRESKNILNQLLKMRIDIACPIYFEIILVKVGKQVLLSKLQELLLRSVTNSNSVSGLEKILLIYECASKVAQHLHDEGLFRLIRTFYIPQN